MLCTAAAAVHDTEKQSNRSNLPRRRHCRCTFEPTAYSSSSSSIILHPPVLGLSRERHLALLPRQRWVCSVVPCLRTTPCCSSAFIFHPRLPVCSTTFGNHCLVVQNPAAAIGSVVVRNNHDLPSSELYILVHISRVCGGHLRCI